ncbi:MAG: LD-carboxypeptidase [Patescibacteria group bacterium]
MIYPKRLKDADKILLTSFSSTSINPTDLEAKIARFEGENGLKIHIDKSLLGTKGRSENLSKYRERMTNCINNIDLHDISALFSIRGGFSITDILLNSKVDIDKLMEKIIEKKAIVLGYSDNTLLSDYLTLTYGYVTYHTPNFEGFYSWSQNSQTLVAKLLKERFEHSFEIKKIKEPDSKNEELSGILISSNLECLTLSLAFTDKIHKELKEKGVILLLEDIYTEPSQAFRYIEVLLMRFKNEGVSVNAIIFGKFPHCKEDNYESWRGKSFTDLLPNLLKYLEIPIFETDKVGHSESDGRIEGKEDEDYLATPNGGFVTIKGGLLIYQL